MTAAWLGEVKARSVADVARALGLRESGRGTFSPCPVCDAEHRGSGDRRGPIGVSGHGWKCHRPGCVKGDAVGLVAAVELGRVSWEGIDARAVHARAYDAGLCTVGPDGEADLPRRRRPTPTPAPVVVEPPGPDAVAVEARDLWSRCVPVVDVAEVAAWLDSRGLDPAAVAKLGTVRALPPDLEDLPGWARYGRAPWGLGWRCVFACFGPDGDLHRLRARWTPSERPTWALKTSGGTEITAGRCVYADPVGRWLLEAGPDARPGDVWSGSGHRWDGSVCIVEGDPDLLTAALDGARWHRGPDGELQTGAVFGVWSGAWKDEHTARIPTGAEVWLALDPDEGGEVYAQQIADSFGRPLRWVRPPSGKDWNDVGAGPWHIMRGAQHGHG